MFTQKRIKLLGVVTEIATSDWHIGSTKQTRVVTVDIGADQGARPNMKILPVLRDLRAIFEITLFKVAPKQSLARVSTVNLNDFDHFYAGIGISLDAN